MKLRLLALILIVTTFACKKEYSYEGVPNNNTAPSKQKCDIITDKMFQQGLPMFRFRFEPPPLGNGYDIFVSQQDYNNNKIGDKYCWTPICNIITAKYLMSTGGGHFMLGDLQYEAELNVPLEVYNMYKQGDTYCNTPRCGFIIQKYTATFNNAPVISYCDTPTGGKNYYVTLTISQADYDKYKLGDYYCYTP